ncbi:hypothetical protein HYW67_01125 [Candidatus Parcubacteria bacterium]|nr:hypothetical protein [Candidatus Parcubacteria bacterium]
MKNAKKTIRPTPTKDEKAQKREELVQKAVEGMKKAVEEYGEVFERLAANDRT